MYKRVFLFLAVILFVTVVGCNNHPDLEITTIESIGPPKINSDGDIHLPVRIVVRNRGDASATRFNIVTEYLLPQGTFEAPFVFSGLRFHQPQRDVTPLSVGREVEVFGEVIFPERHYGWTAVLKARLECCDPETSVPAHTHQQESYTDNNESWPIQIVLAAETVSLK